MTLLLGCFFFFSPSKEKKKVNCKPKNQDEQEIPFRLREIMRSRQEMKKTLSNKKRKKEGMYSLCCVLRAIIALSEPIQLPKYLKVFEARGIHQDQALGVQGMRRIAQG